MPRGLKYRCPVCNKPLTKREFERAFKIHDGQRQHLEARERELKSQERKFNAEKRRLKGEARQKERERTRRIVKGKDLKIHDLKETIRALKRGKTQQEFGSEFEFKLVKQLKREFEDKGDEIQHKGKGGDVLHLVKEGGKIAGVIIYECKYTPGIHGSHIRQTARAKMVRNAQFAVLVTSGTRRGFNGLDVELGVTIVAPAGVLALAGLLRSHLVEMFRAGIEKRRRTRIANQVLRFVKSPEFKNPVEEVVRTAEGLKTGIREEFIWHRKDWEKRLNAYGTISWDATAIQANLQRVFRGEAPKQLSHPKEKLALPA